MSIFVSPTSIHIQPQERRISNFLENTISVVRLINLGQLVGYMGGQSQSNIHFCFPVNSFVINFEWKKVPFSIHAINFEFLFLYIIVIRHDKKTVWNILSFRKVNEQSLFWLEMKIVLRYFHNNRCLIALTHSHQILF